MHTKSSRTNLTRIITESWLIMTIVNYFFWQTNLEFQRFSELKKGDNVKTWKQNRWSPWLERLSPPPFSPVSIQRDKKDGFYKLFSFFSHSRLSLTCFTWSSCSLSKEPLKASFPISRLDHPPVRGRGETRGLICFLHHSDQIHYTAMNRSIGRRRPLTLSFFSGWLWPFWPSFILSVNAFWLTDWLCFEKAIE